MTILDWVKEQDRGVLPREVNKAFPDKTSKQIGDSLADYVQRGKIRKILIPSAGRRYRYIADEKQSVKKEKFGKSEINPAVLPLVRF
jgi:hypothetical protein